MKVIDEKGKLFGKLNIIDLLAILVILAVIVFVGWRFTHQEEATASSTGTTPLTYTVQVTSASREVAAEVQRQLANAGGRDQLMASGKMLDAWVTDVKVTPHINYQPDENGVVTTSVEQGDNARLDLLFTVEANVVNPTVNQVGTQEVRVGKSHILKTVHFEFSYGSIITCEWG